MTLSNSVRKTDNHSTGIAFLNYSIIKRARSGFNGKSSCLCRDFADIHIRQFPVRHTQSRIVFFFLFYGGASWLLTLLCLLILNTHFKIHLKSCYFICIYFLYISRRAAVLCTRQPGGFLPKILRWSKSPTSRLLRALHRSFMSVLSWYIQKQLLWPQRSNFN